MKKQKDRLTWRGVAAAGAAMLVIVGLLLWRNRGTDGGEAPDSPVAVEGADRSGKGEKKNGTTNGDVHPPVVVAPEAPADKEKDAVPTSPGGKEAEAFVKRPGALQLPDGRVLTFPPPKEGEIRKVYSHGHLYECDHEGNFAEVTKRQLFRTAFEANFLGLAVADKPFIPAFLTGLDEADVRAALAKPYEPKGDETEEELAQLRAYDEMRALALQYMDGGGSFDDFVEAFARQVREERAANAACLREVMTLYKQGRLAEARAAAESADALKRENGLDPLRLPPHVRERLGLGPGK